MALLICCFAGCLTGSARQGPVPVRGCTAASRLREPSKVRAGGAGAMGLQGREGGADELWPAPVAAGSGPRAAGWAGRQAAPAHRRLRGPRGSQRAPRAPGQPLPWGGGLGHGERRPPEPGGAWRVPESAMTGTSPSSALRAGTPGAAVLSRCSCGPLGWPPVLHVGGGRGGRGRRSAASRPGVRRGW